MGFAIGKISFVAALFGVFLMYANFWVRTFNAWYHKSEPPKDRVSVGAIGMGVFCFVLGSVLQPEADKVATCTASGYTLSECILPVAR